VSSRSFAERPAQSPPKANVSVPTSERCPSCGGATEPLHSTLEPLMRCTRCGVVSSSLPNDDPQSGKRRLMLVPRNRAQSRDTKRGPV
jgi:uncharacterized Zn finger protein